MTRNNVTRALQRLRAGAPVVVADDLDRENEGDLIIAAEKITPALLAFLLRHTSGVVCVAITEARAQQLALPLMVPDNREPYRTQFTVSVDFKHGTSTGISAKDRSAAIRGLGDHSATAADFLRPGHVFPLIARDGGVLERRGHTEAAVDLARLAGLQPAGALCELVGLDGEVLRGAELVGFARTHGLAFLTIDELAAYRAAAAEAVGQQALLRRTQPSARALQDARNSAASELARTLQ